MLLENTKFLKKIETVYIDIGICINKQSDSASIITIMQLFKI